MQSLEPFSGWIRTVVMMKMMMMSSRRRASWQQCMLQSAANRGRGAWMAEIRTQLALSRSLTNGMSSRSSKSMKLASPCVFSIIQSINKRHRTWRVWLRLEVCEIKYQKWYYLPVISSAAHSHMAFWCRHQQKAVIGLHLPEPVPNLISFSNNAQKNFQTRASERTRRHEELSMICKYARVINCDRMHLPRWRVCTFFFLDL